MCNGINYEEQHYMNYADMCRKNGMPILSGNSKISHLKSIGEDYISKKDKTGNGFSLKRRKKSKPKLDKRKLKIGKYSELVDAIVLFRIKNGFSGESMQIIRLDVFRSLDYVYGCSALGGCMAGYKETLGDELFDSVNREVISLIYRHVTSSLCRLQRKGIIEVSQYYEFKEGISTPEEFSMIKEIKKMVLWENEIRNEYILEALMKDSTKEMIHNEIKNRVFNEIGVTILRKVTNLKIIDKKARIPNPKQYKDSCEKLFPLMQELLIKRARRKCVDGMDDDTMRMLELFGETEIQKLEKFYLEHIRYEG